jgi:hypothetical protein
MVPADSRAQPQPAPRQQVNVGRLPRHERCLALREDQDPGGETDPLGDAGEVGEHHERVMERVVLGLGAGEQGRPAGVNSSEHVVIGEEMIKAQVLGSSPDPPDSARVPAELGLRVDDTDLQGARRRLLQGLPRAFSQSSCCRRSRGSAMRLFPSVLVVHAGCDRFPGSRDACACAAVPGPRPGLVAALCELCLLRRRQGVGWLVGGSPAGEEPEGVVGG